MHGGIVYNDSPDYSPYDDFEVLDTKQSKFGNCECEKLDYSYPCDETDFNDSSNKQASDMLFYADSEDYNAFFWTGEDFGCIHYREKE